MIVEADQELQFDQRARRQPSREKLEIKAALDQPDRSNRNDTARTRAEDYSRMEPPVTAEIRQRQNRGNNHQLPRFDPEIEAHQGYGQCARGQAELRART